MTTHCLSYPLPLAASFVFHRKHRRESKKAREVLATFATLCRTSKEVRRNVEYYLYRHQKFKINVLLPILNITKPDAASKYELQATSFLQLRNITLDVFITPGETYRQHRAILRFLMDSEGICSDPAWTSKPYLHRDNTHGFARPGSRNRFQLWQDLRAKDTVAKFIDKVQLPVFDVAGRVGPSLAVMQSLCKCCKKGDSGYSDTSVQRKRTRRKGEWLVGKSSLTMGLR